MNSQASQPVFIADSCIGGLSVVKAMWNTGHMPEAHFMADYEVNPLGLKSDTDIADVVKKWLNLAEQHSDTLLIACNTLSIRYFQLMQSKPLSSNLKQVISMVDCFEALVRSKIDFLDNKRVLIIGTAFTASQHLYPGILHKYLPGSRVNGVAATDLERKIARFQLDENEKGNMITKELEQAIGNTDVAILACTCFPMVKVELESMFPNVTFLDPGACCAELIEPCDIKQRNRLSIDVTGNVVTKERVTAFVNSYLGPVLQ